MSRRPPHTPARDCHAPCSPPPPLYPGFDYDRPTRPTPAEFEITRYSIRRTGVRSQTDLRDYITCRVYEMHDGRRMDLEAQTDRLCAEIRVMKNRGPKVVTTRAEVRREIQDLRRRWEECGDE